MGDFFFGALACAVVYTFFPALAVKPSEWLRRAYAWIKSQTAG